MRDAEQRRGAAGGVDGEMRDDDISARVGYERTGTAAAGVTMRERGDRWECGDDERRN